MEFVFALTLSICLSPVDCVNSPIEKERISYTYSTIDRCVMQSAILSGMKKIQFYPIPIHVEASCDIELISRVYVQQSD